MIEIELTDITQNEYEQDNNLNFMTMSMKKFVALTILTLGAYNIIWFFKYWEQIKKAYNLNIRTIWRTIFIMFTCFRLFSIINKHLKKYNSEISPLHLTIIYILGCLFTKLPEFLSLLSILCYVPQFIIQHKINQINTKHNLPAEQSTWTWITTRNIIIYWLICGTLYLTAAFLTYQTINM